MKINNCKYKFKITTIILFCYFSNNFAIIFPSFLMLFFIYRCFLSLTSKKNFCYIFNVVISAYTLKFTPNAK